MITHKDTMFSLEEVTYRLARMKDQLKKSGFEMDDVEELREALEDFGYSLHAIWRRRKEIQSRR